MEEVHDTMVVVRAEVRESHTEKSEVERVVERKVSVPCDCPVCDGVKPVGVAVLDERIVERAVKASESLRFEVSDLGLGSSSSVAQKSVETPPRPPAWRLGVLGGATGGWKPVLGVYGTRRLAGPFEAGVWAVGTKDLKLTGGVSVGLTF